MFWGAGSWKSTFIPSRARFSWNTVYKKLVKSYKGQCNIIMIILCRNSPHKMVKLYHFRYLHGVGSSLAPEKYTVFISYQKGFVGSFYTQTVNKHSSKLNQIYNLPRSISLSLVSKISSVSKSPLWYPPIACFSQTTAKNIVPFQLYKTEQLYKSSHLATPKPVGFVFFLHFLLDKIVIFCESIDLVLPELFFLPLKKCRTDEPVSPPNKVFASSQVSPTTSSSTATALRGPIKTIREKTHGFTMANKFSLEFKKDKQINHQPVNLMFHNFIDLDRDFKKCQTSLQSVVTF